MASIQMSRWVTPRKILLATDLADLKHTLPVAINDAISHRAHLTIAHVLAGPGAMPIDPTLLIYGDPVRLEDEARAQLADAVAKAHAAGASCSFTLAQGRVVDELLKLVADCRADRVVAGTRGTGKFLLHILGSTAASLFHRVEIPVLAVPPNNTAGADSSRTAYRMLLATSLGHGEEQLAELAMRVAEQASAELMLLHILPNMSESHPATVRVEEHAGKALADLSRMVRVRRCNPVCEIAHGQPVEEIVARATAWGADLILLGASTHSAFNERFLPGTAYRVLCSAPCPVLVLKHESTWQTPSQVEHHATPLPEG